MHFGRTIHSLPVELLSHIFVLGTHYRDVSDDEAELQETPPFNSESVKAPLVYSSVCRHWRSVAINTPALWTSICITVGSLETSRHKSSFQEPTLKTSHIESYLSLSRKYPLDILLDVRDIDWDFWEPELSFSYDSGYRIPFSSNSMRTVMALLLPHLSRWRSIDILTDTWAPMHAALKMLNAPLTTLGAPLLESLTLMRCNDYISHSPHFQPQHLKIPFFLRPNGPLPKNSIPLLPRLRNIVLRGVHVDWSSLPDLLPTDSPVLRTLELSSHSLDVRPTASQFRDILASCRSLQTLIINGSGISFDQGGEMPLKLGAGANKLDKRLSPIALPHLKELTLGYRTALDGCYVLSMLEAPNLRSLTLEDATKPSDVEEVDASHLLRYVAARDMVESVSDLREAQGVSSGLVGPYTEESDESDMHYSRRLLSPIPGPSRSQPDRSRALPPFPYLERLTLKGLKARTSDFQRFFLSLPHLKSLDIRGMPSPMIAVVALTSTLNLTCPNISRSESLSNQGGWAPLCSAPCPQLQELCIRGGHLRLEDLEYIVRDLVNNRSLGRACGLKQLDIHLEGNSRDIPADTKQSLFEGCSSSASDNAPTSSLHDKTSEALSGLASAANSTGVVVRLYGTSDVQAEDGSLDSDAEVVEHELDEAFGYGGAFNDPIFDAQYSSALSH